MVVAGLTSVLWVVLSLLTLISPTFSLVGGRPAAESLKNWVVNVNGRCGGVFLDENHVLTAASCLMNRDRAGEPELEPKDIIIHYHCLHAPGQAKDCDQSVAAKRLMVHPCYQGRTVGVHDVAVIWLNRTIPVLSASTLPVLDGWNSTTGPLFPNLDDGAVDYSGMGESTRFAGWGHTGYNVQTGQPLAAAALYEGLLPTVNGSYCKHTYATANTSSFETALDFEIPRMICAGLGLGNDRFVCNGGDEGGPLYYTSTTGRPIVVGIFSSQTLPQGAQADRCNVDGRRGTFTRIAYYRGWVVQAMITKSKGFCEPAQRYRSPNKCPVGSWGSMSGCQKCPAGRFGSIPNLHSADCSGVCAAGYFCKAGSVSPHEQACNTPDKFCRYGSPTLATTADGYYAIDLEGRAAPASTEVQWPNEFDALRVQYFVNQRLCEQGHFCIGGVKTPCPVGTYGLEFGLSRASCDGPCYAGYYCPRSSVTPTKCSPGNWCDGNASIPCPSGRYGSVPQLGSPTCSGPCKEGHYCPPGSTSETQARCPAGTYGATRGLGSRGCSGECLEGFYCPTGSTQRNQFECGDAEHFCPASSPAPLKTWAGYFSEGGNVDGTTRTKQTKCPKGSYCRFGLRFDCPAGTYGAAEGVQINTCTGPATPGFYTPRGSISPTQFPCPAGRYGTGGDSDAECSGPCALGHYCPENSTTAMQVKCPAGRYGDSLGLQSVECSVDCFEGVCVRSSMCTKGYYCPEGSTSSREKSCGNETVYCPVGSPAPVVAPPGFYTVNGEAPIGRTQGGSGYYNGVIGDISMVVSDTSTRSAIVKCEKGHFCADGVKTKCPRGRYGKSKGLSSDTCSGLVDPGHWSNEGATMVRERKCKAGRYAMIPGSTSGECEGPCLPGYYCPSGSLSATQKHCGSPQVFCPSGSARPIRVSKGYYSVDMHGNNHSESATTRTKQLRCPIGSYCQNGIRKVCPAGRYGRKDSLSSPSCSGACLRGYYCPQESTYPASHASSTNMKVCPAGKYNGKFGGKSLADCLPCKPGYSCLPGSVDQYGEMAPRSERVWH